MKQKNHFEIIKLWVSSKTIPDLVFFTGPHRNNHSSYYTSIPSVLQASDQVKETMYFIIGIMVLIGVYSMRWNVVIGGQLFSKSFSGFTSFKVGLIGLDGTLMAAFWLLLPIGILAFLLWLLPPWKMVNEED